MTLAIAARVARQLRHDPRTLALVTFVPSILAWLVHQIFDGEEPISSQVEMTLLAMFPLLLMFLLTAVATVRERSGGTLERLMAAPIHKVDVIGGYALAYGALAIVQTSLLTAVCYWGLDMQLRGGIVWMLLVSLATALLGIALGLLASAVSVAVTVTGTTDVAELGCGALLAPIAMPVKKAISPVIVTVMMNFAERCSWDRYPYHGCCAVVTIMAVLWEDQPMRSSAASPYSAPSCGCESPAWALRGALRAFSACELSGRGHDEASRLSPSIGCPR